MQIIIASKNLHKIRELKTILKGKYPFDLLSLLDFPDYKSPEETGKTFEENAFLKASKASKALNSWVLAEDSGLVVPSLDYQPGIKSARYAGENATDKENRNKLVDTLSNLDEDSRTGYYYCAIAIASPSGVQIQVSASCEGSLTINPKGSYGFGYDPLFKKYEYNKTFAEIDEETKNKISHRRKALDKLSSFFDSLISRKNTFTNF